MRPRTSPSFYRNSLILTSAAVTVTFAFAACGTGPAVVTNADDALGIRPATSASTLPAASASAAAPITSASAKPLLVAAPGPRELPPFSCAPERQLDILGATFCVIPDARNWHDAEAVCQDHGGHLAVVRNASFSNALRTAAISATGVDRFWIGLAEPSEGRWLWSNGTPAKFFAWGSGEPNNFGGRGEDCGDWETLSGRWNDANCFTTMHFMCEGKTPPRGSRTKPIACTGKRFTVGQSDYCLQGPATWGDAQKQCVKDGGELAMMDSAEENAALFRALGAKVPAGNLWVGLTDEAVEGQFQWVSGDPVEAVLWRPGEPNNSGGNEDCTEWIPSDGLWNDVECRTNLPSLCERPATTIAK